jgi:site-specific recombinase
MTTDLHAAVIRDQVVEVLDHGLGSDHDAYELAACFAAIANARTAAHRLNALLALHEWTQWGPDDGNGPALSSRVLRAIEVLEALPEVRRRLQDTLAEVLRETEGVNLFGETGIPARGGLVAQLRERVMRRILPEPSDEHDLARLTSRLYGSRVAAERFRLLAPELFHRLVRALAPADRPEIHAPLRAAFADGFRLLSVRVQGQGLSANFRTRRYPLPVAQSPFYRLVFASDALIDAWLAEEDDFSSAGAWQEQWAGCNAAIDEMSRRMQSDGASTESLYGLETLGCCLSRMRAMFDVIIAAPGQARSEAIHRLFAALVVAAHDERGILELLDNKLRRFQRKLVAREAMAAEPYVAHSSRESRFIWLAAAGGGLAAVLIVAIRLKASTLGLPLFVEGLLAGLTYAVGFLLLHHLHLLLCGKQPALTAAALAGLLRHGDRATRDERVIEYTLGVCRSQLAAAVANVALVFAGAFVFNLLWRMTLGHNFLAAKQAQRLFDTLGPLSGATLGYAALTGVLLWLAAMIGAWMDNWAVLHRLPQAVADHRLGERFARRRMVHAAGIVARNMSGWANSISLGLLLGLVPVLGGLGTLALDIRHVTLSSGMLAFAGYALHGWFSAAWLLRALASVTLVLFLNLSVSYFLALYTAWRACGLPRRELLGLGPKFLRRLWWRRT